MEQACAHVDFVDCAAVSVSVSTCPLSVPHSMLALGGAVTLDDLAAHASADLSGLLGGIANEDLPARRAKVEAQVGGGWRGRQASVQWVV